MSEVAEVIIEAEATPDEVEALERVFREAGVPANVSATLIRASRDLLPWALIITIAAKDFLKSFGSAAGTDAWKGLKALVVRIFETRRRSGRPEGAIRWDDVDRTIVLTDRMPDEAFRQIAADELPPGGYFVWDEERQDWIQP